MQGADLSPGRLWINVKNKKGASVKKLSIRSTLFPCGAAEFLKGEIPQNIKSWRGVRWGGKARALTPALANSAGWASVGVL